MTQTIYKDISLKNWFYIRLKKNIKDNIAWDKRLETLKAMQDQDIKIDIR